jgi:hypothetical protein
MSAINRSNTKPEVPRQCLIPRHSWHLSRDIIDTARRPQYGDARRSCARGSVASTKVVYASDMIIGTGVS